MRPAGLPSPPLPWVDGRPCAMHRCHAISGGVAAPHHLTPPPPPVAVYIERLNGGMILAPVLGSLSTHLQAPPLHNTHQRDVGVRGGCALIGLISQW